MKASCFVFLLIFLAPTESFSRRDTQPPCLYQASFRVQKVYHYATPGWEEHYDIYLEDNSTVPQQISTTSSAGAVQTEIQLEWKIKSAGSNIPRFSSTFKSPTINQVKVSYFPLRIKLTMKDKKNWKTVCNGTVERIFHLQTMLSAAENYTYIYAENGEKYRMVLKREGKYVIKDASEIPDPGVREHYIDAREAAGKKKAAGKVRTNNRSVASAPRIWEPLRNIRRIPRDLGRLRIHHPKVASGSVVPVSDISLHNEIYQLLDLQGREVKLDNINQLQPGIYIKRQYTNGQWKAQKVWVDPLTFGHGFDP